MILSVVLPVALVAFSLALLLAAWRLLRGPSSADRALALDTLYINALAIVVLLGIVWNSTVMFEVALLIGLLGFVGTVAVAKFVLRGRLVE